MLKNGFAEFCNNIFYHKINKLYFNTFQIKQYLNATSMYDYFFFILIYAIVLEKMEKTGTKTNEKQLIFMQLLS